MHCFYLITLCSGPSVWNLFRIPKRSFFDGLPKTSNWQLCSRDLSYQTQAPQAIVCIVVVSYEPTFTESLYATYTGIRVFHVYICICYVAIQKQRICLQSSISLTWVDTTLLSTTISIAKPCLEHLFCYIQSYHYIEIKKKKSFCAQVQARSRKTHLPYNEVNSK